MSLLVALPMGALTLDADLSICAANPVFLDLLGYKDEEVLGRCFRDLVLPAQASALPDLLELDAPAGVELEVRFISARGGSLAATVSVVRADGADGGQGHLSITLEQLDRAYAAQETLRLSEALSLAKVGNWELEVETGRILASQNWLELWGLPPNQASRLEAVLHRIHPEDRALVESALQQARQETSGFHIRFRLQRPDGEMRWAEATGRLYPDDSGWAGRMCGAILDITEQRNAEQAVARYSDIVSATTDRIAFVDPACRILAANSAFLRALDRGQDEVVNLSFMDACGPGQLSTAVCSQLPRCIGEATTLSEDIRETAEDGSSRDAEVRLFPHRDERGTTTGVVVNIRDVTGLRDAERRLLQSAAVYAATSEGVLITDASGTIVAVNPAFTQITGYTEAEVLGQKPNLLSSQWHTRGFFIGMWRRLLRHGSWQGEIWNRRKDGEVYRQRLTIRRIDDRRGRLVSFVGVFAERSSSPESPHRAEDLIHYDALTKLPNRLLFESRLEHALELARRKEAPTALFILDLDHFAHINSSLGYQIGDDLLRAVARKLREAIRPADTLARLRADQFGLLFEEISQADEVTEIARRLQEAMRAPIWIRSHLLHVNISVGIALSSGSGGDHRSIVASAESALRQVKRQGRNGFLISTARPDEAQHEHQRLVRLLQSGLENGDFRLLYRPGVELETGTCDYVEAVLHWEQRELGPIPNERLLALANESGLMLDVGAWALRAACRQLHSWVSKGVQIRSHAIKVCEAQLTRGDLVRQLTRLLEEYPSVAPRLVLEFSEGLLVKHREQAAEVFHGLAQLGVAITLSEVGIGWTAPAVLQRLPVKTLKIHSSFIEGLPDSVHELAVVEVLIAMAQALHLDIRADGVRTQEQKFQLMTLGCLHAQGDMFSVPLTASQLEAWLNPKQRSSPPTPRES